VNELLTATVGGILIITLTFFVVLIIGHKNDVLLQSGTSFFIQITLASIFFYRFGLYEDALLYSSIGTDIAGYWSRLIPIEFEGFNKRNQLPLTSISLFYLFFGPYPLLPILFNCFLVALIPALIASACRNFGLMKSAKIAAWFVILIPSITLNGPWLRKEAQAFFLISVLILAMSYLYKNQIIRGLLIGIVVIYLFSIIRSQLMIVGIVGLFSSFFLNPATISFYRIFSKKLQKRIILVIFACSSLIISPILLYFYRIQGFRNSSGFDKLLKSNSDFSQATANIGASWSVNTNPIIFIYNLFRTLWGPPIWEWRNLSMVIFGLEGLFVLMISFHGFISYYFNKKFRKVFLILFIAIMPLWIPSSLMLSNYGLNSRIRAHYLLFLIPIIAAYFGELPGHGFNRKADNFKSNLKSKTLSKKLNKEDRRYKP
jgi:hypothetical protein